jgi:CubicO group peptidase (beta-lactamase class C family)
MSRLLLALCISFLGPTYAAHAQEAPADCPTPAKLDDGWTIATPKDSGFDPDKLCSLDKFIAQSADAKIHGVVIARHGKLIIERYYDGTDFDFHTTSFEAVKFGPMVKHDLHSISKSVTSLLIGIAGGEGKFPDLASLMIDHLPPIYADLRAADARITIRDLLTMSSGFDWNERLPYNDPKNMALQMVLAPEPYRFVLQQRVAFEPGTVYNYNSGNTELLGLVLSHSIGRPIDDYARDKLFRPLGITDFSWWKIPNSGQPFAAGGLQLRPRDLAKIGQLLLSDGQWNGEQVVPKGWTAESTKSRIKAGIFFYGYQWWLGRTVFQGRELHWTAGFGNGGQSLFVLPELDLVVVVAAGLYQKPPLAQVVFPLNIFEQRVLPAITGN